jgi:chromosome segregation ATPase
MSFSQEEINLLIEKAEINRAKARRQSIWAIALPMLATIVYLGITISLIKDKQTELAEIDKELAETNKEIEKQQTELAEIQDQLQEKKDKLKEVEEELKSVNPELLKNPEFEQTINDLNEILGSNRIKIRYTESSKEDAFKIRDLLQAQGIRNVEIDQAAISVDRMKFYWYAQGYEIRYDKQTELQKASELQKAIQSSLGLQITLRESTTPSPNFLSIFLSKS